jgi:hypothetical protein
MAQKDNNRDIAVWVGDFTGLEGLPDLSVFKTLTLPSGLSANCFDFRSFSAKGDAVLNCQTIPASAEEDPSDLLCRISPDADVLQMGDNCKLFPSAAKTTSRQSKILTIGAQTYLLSESSDINGGGAGFDFITIYYLNQKGEFVFANIIDSNLLPDGQLQITDYVVTQDNQIIIADTQGSRLVYFEYLASNEITITKIIGLSVVPQALSYTTQDTLLLASAEAITEHDASNPSKVLNKYELDSTDNQVTSIKGSSSMVVFTTKSGRLYIYQRNVHQLNYLLERVVLPAGTQLLLSEDVSYLYIFNTTFAQSIAVGSPYFTLTPSAANVNDTFTITATSFSQTCEVNFKLRVLDS